MKKIYFLAAFAAIVVTVFYACSKNESQLNQSSDNSRLSSRDIEVNRLINRMQDKMAYIRKNPAAKTDETVSADSALWYMEATINYEHGFPNKYYEEFQIDTTSVIVNKNSNGTVNLTELTQKYDEMKAGISTAYHSVAYADKGLAVVDLEKVSEDGSKIVISVKSSTGKVNPVPDTLNTNAPEDWWYGEEMGRCDIAGGLGDAADKLWNKLNIRIQSEGNFYYIDEVDVYFKGGDTLIKAINNNTEPDNHLDYYLYYLIKGTDIPYSEDMKCIPDADMDTYYNYLEYLVYDYIPLTYIPDDYGYYHHQVVECTLLNDKKIGDPQAVEKYFHQMWLIYGEKVSKAPGMESTEIQ